MEYYETKPVKEIEQGKNLYELLNASFQGIKRLFGLAYSLAAWQNPVTRYSGDFVLSPFFRLSAPGKRKSKVTFHQKLFFKGCEWQNLVTSCFHCSYFTGQT